MASEMILRGLTGDDKKRAIATIEHSPVIARLREILTQLKGELKTTRGDYSEGWAFKQAHENGMLEAYDKVQRLLDHKEK